MPKLPKTCWKCRAGNNGDECWRCGARLPGTIENIRAGKPSVKARRRWLYTQSGGDVYSARPLRKWRR